jgi:hypothetical protein
MTALRERALMAGFGWKARMSAWLRACVREGDSARIGDVSQAVMHPVYLPFEEHKLRGHFIEVKGEPTSDPERHLAYYRHSIERWRAHQDVPAPAPRDVRRARQIEKDERFWGRAIGEHLGLE